MQILCSGFPNAIKTLRQGNHGTAGVANTAGEIGSAKAAPCSLCLGRLERTHLFPRPGKMKWPHAKGKTLQD